MNCIFIKSDETHKNGKAYWYCSRKGCSNRCVSDDGKCVATCEHPTLNIPLGDIAVTAIETLSLGMIKAGKNSGCGAAARQRELNKEIPLPNVLVRRRCNCRKQRGTK